MPVTKFGNSSFIINKRRCSLDDMLSMPSSSKNLLSVKCFYCDNKVSVWFNSHSVKVVDDKTQQTSWKERLTGTLLVPTYLTKRDGDRAFFLEKIASDQAWYIWLGHLHSRTVTNLVCTGLISLSKPNIVSIDYDSCFVSKTHKSPHPSRSSIYPPLSVIFSDDWGLALTISRDGYRYYLNLVDGVTSFNWMYLYIISLR